MCGPLPVWSLALLTAEPPPPHFWLLEGEDLLCEPTKFMSFLAWTRTSCGKTSSRHYTNFLPHCGTISWNYPSTFFPSSLIQYIIYIYPQNGTLYKISRDYTVYFCEQFSYTQYIFVNNLSTFSTFLWGAWVASGLFRLLVACAAAGHVYTLRAWASAGRV